MPDVNVNKVDPGKVLGWFSQGWRTFMANPVHWLLAALLLGVIAVGLGWIPFLGAVVLNLILPVILGGMLQMARAAQAGQAVDVMDMFSLFKEPAKRNQLLMVGGLMLGASIVMALLSGLFMGDMVTFDPVSGVPSFHFSMEMLVFMLVAGVLMGMLFTYAPSLVVFKDKVAVDAVKGSFQGALTNILPFLLFGLLYVVLSFVASIPLMLGFLVLIPVMAGAVYASYQDMFA